MGSEWSRRQFLRTLTGTLAIRIDPAFRPAGESRLIIGLGGAGTNIQRRLQDDGFPARYWVWNSQASFFADLLTRLDDCVPKPMRAGRARRLVVPDAILGEAVLVRRFASDALKEFRTPLPRVAIVVGLGGRTGSALVAPL